MRAQASNILPETFWETFVAKSKNACLVEWVTASVVGCYYASFLVTGNMANAELWPVCAILAVTRLGDTIKAFSPWEKNHGENAI